MLDSGGFPGLAAVAVPFVTVLSSDLCGPRRRERSVLKREKPPEWLGHAIEDVREGESVIVAAGGKLRGGSSLRIRSIIVFRERHGVPETAYVYVEEWDTGARLCERAYPVHVVRCAALPAQLRFVEVPHESRPLGRAALRSIRGARE